MGRPISVGSISETPEKVVARVTKYIEKQFPNMSPAEALSTLPKAERDAWLGGLTELELRTLEYEWKFWARPKQREPQPAKYKVLVLLSGRGFGKEFRASTEIPTPAGFTPIRDLKVGDTVFDEAGNQTRVAGVYPQGIRQLYRVKFSDGTFLDAGAEHQWVTWDRAERKAFLRSPYEDITRFPANWPQWRLRRSDKNTHRGLPECGPQIRTTADLISTLTYGKRGDRNHCIPTCGSLQLPDADLPIDPYMIGYYLGDGCRRDGSISVGKQDVAWVLQVFSLFQPVYMPESNVVRLKGFASILRPLWLHEVKYLPSMYLRGSESQRTSVLQGLMDSDGFAHDTGSHVEFCNTNPFLADAVMELATSLGQKPVRSVGRATLYGKDCGLKYRVTWKPTIDVFRLPRKRDRVKMDKAQSLRNHHRMIVAIESIDADEAFCISVDSPNRMYLAGRGMIPTHNTRTAAEIVRGWIESGEKKHVALVAANAADLRDTMVEAVYKQGSGLYQICPPWNRPKYSPTKKTLVWDNPNYPSYGSVCSLYSAEEPDCYDDITEILTDQGWKLFRDLNRSEMILTGDPKTMTSSWQKPVRYIDQAYTGPMVSIRSKKTDLVVTPSHKLLVRNNHSTDAVFVDARSVSPYASIPRDIHFDGSGSISEDECALMGFFLAEGSVYGSRGGDISKRKGAYEVTFCQTKGIKGGTKGDVRRLFSEVLDRLGYRYSKNGKVGLTVIKKELWERLRPLGNSSTKYVPYEYKNLPVHKLRILLHWMLMGDGGIRRRKANHKERREFYSTNYVLASDVQEIAAKCGIGSTLRTFQLSGGTVRGRKIEHSRPVHIVSLYDSRGAYLHSTDKGSYLTSVHYSGRVYCVEMPSGNAVLVRRNGRVSWSGNSLRGPSHDGAWMDEWCLIAGTQIRTDAGELPIENVRPGVRVWTRSGLREVETVSSRVSGDIMTVVLSDGTTLTGTGDHPIWVKNSGFKPIKDIHPYDIIYTWNQLNRTYSGEVDDGGLTVATMRTDKGNFYTGRSTEPRTGRFQRAHKSTIKTRIGSIMTSLISKHLHHNSIERSTAESAVGTQVGQESVEVGRKEGNGLHGKHTKPNACYATGSTLHVLGTRSTALRSVSNKRTATRNDILQAPSVSTVRVHSGDQMQVDRKSTVLGRAGRLGPVGVAFSRNSGNRQSRVPSVAVCSNNPASEPLHALKSADISSEVHVVRVEKLRGSRRVFNMEVRDCPEYFANGVLTHNCKMKYGDTVWHMLKFTLRLGLNPQTVISTTPKPVPFLIEMLKAAEESKADGTNEIIVIKGNTYENRSNLSAEFLKDINEMYEGTTLGRQEIYADLILDAEGALWNLGMIDDCRLRMPKDGILHLPSFHQTVVGVDPQTGYRIDSDSRPKTVVARSTLTGIVVAASSVRVRGIPPHAYVLADMSINGKPETWAQQAITAYRIHDASLIIAERNQGGEMIESVIRSIDPSVRVKLVTATTKKHERAVPVVAKYQQGRVHHVGVLPQLEQEMVLYEPGDEDRKLSPNRMDALVWAVRYLIVDGLRPGAGVAISRRV